MTGPGPGAGKRLETRPRRPPLDLVMLRGLAHVPERPARRAAPPGTPCRSGSSSSPHSRSATCSDHPFVERANTAGPELRWVGVGGLRPRHHRHHLVGLDRRANPADPTWVIAYLLPLEGAIRYGLVGASLPVAVTVASEFARQLNRRKDGFQGVRPAPRRVPRGHGAGRRRRRRLMARSHGARGREGPGASARRRGIAAREAQARSDQLAAFHDRDPGRGRRGGPRERHPVDGRGDRTRPRVRGRSACCCSRASATGSLEVVHGDPGVPTGTRAIGAPAVVAGRAPCARAAALDGRPGRSKVRPRPSSPLRAERPRSDCCTSGAPGRARSIANGSACWGGSPIRSALVVQAARLRARQEETLQRLRELDEHEVRLRRDHEPRAAHPARRGPRVREHAPPPARASCLPRRSRSSWGSSTSRPTG